MPPLTTVPARHVHENWHALSDEESHLEEAVLAALGLHFASFAGSRREAYDAMTARTPIADAVAVEHVDQAPVQGWWVRPHAAPADRGILFLHGGAYMLGSAKAYRGFVSQLAVRTGVAAFIPDYPLAPEHPFPAAYDAVIAAGSWLHGEGFEQLSLVGDSAGGGLALAALGRGQTYPPKVASAVVFSPWVDLALSGSSLSDPNTRDPIFQAAVLEAAASTYLDGADPRDGRASPLYDIPAKLPPLAIQVGSRELLLDDACRFAHAAAACGGKVQLDVFDGLHHVFQRSTEELPSARVALDDAAGFISAHWL